jgi:host factor-I protein
LPSLYSRDSGETPGRRVAATARALSSWSNSGLLESCLLDRRLSDQLLRFVYNPSMSFRPPGNPNAAKRGRTPPPDDTHEEVAFLKQLGEKQKAVSIKLMDGQTVRGWIEYYDRNMVRLTREGAPNLFIFKHEIMYITEETGRKK